MDALAERLRREAQLSMQGVEQSTGRTETIAFTLSYSGKDPQTVAQVANTLAGFYVDGNTQSRERQATETAEFLEAQLNGRETGARRAGAAQQRSQAASHQ